MEYSKLRNKVGKFYNGGKIPKYQMGGSTYNYDESRASDPRNPDYWMKRGMLPKQAQFKAQEIQENGLMMPTDVEIDAIEEESPEGLQKLMQQSEQNLSGIMQQEGVTSEQLAQKKQDLINRGVIKEPVSQNSVPKESISNIENTLEGVGGLSSGAIGMGIASKAITGVANTVDDLTMGDKNFGAQSAAIDSAVHGVSGALMSSGNPYAMAAGAALEGANFLTKAGGETVQGFDVNIESSGFGDIGHMESSSSRDFGAMIGLGGLFTGNIEKKLAKRNEQARMAMQAAEISEDIKFEQEARMNSVDNVLRNNQIALAGGIDTSLLGS